MHIHIYTYIYTYIYVHIPAHRQAPGFAKKKNIYICTHQPIVKPPGFAKVK